MSMPTADWFLLGKDTYFRKIELYTMGWHNEVNMDNAIAVGAPYAGPIAVKRDPNKMIKAQSSGQSFINIYSGSGKLFNSIKDNKSIIKVGWTNAEQLICVHEDGTISIHNVFTSYFDNIHNIHVSQEVRDTKIIDAIIFTNPQNFTGIAVLTTNFKVFIINNVNKPKQRQLSELTKSSLKPTAWCVISEENSTDVLIARGRELYRLKQDERHATDMLEPEIVHEYTSIMQMAVSSNARYLAIFTDAGHIWMGSADLRTKLTEIDTDMIVKPKYLEWCGTEAVVAFWEKDYTLMVIFKNDYGCSKMTFNYDSTAHLVSEIDGVRILSNFQHELLQKVPATLQKIFRIYSNDPGSYLLEASKQYQRRSHKADEYICLVKANLEKAVEQCIEAAGYEFDTENQKMLIRAAQFGKCFSSEVDPADYVKMCRLLRVLNAVRDRRIGIGITFTQLQYLTHGVLLDRLVARRQYYLAIQIAKYLKMPDNEGSNRILVHWAKYKVSKPDSMDDDRIAKQIGEKLNESVGVCYSEIAKTAADNGRKKLAIKLLDYEPKASKQVELLVHLEEHEPALVKAIESGDTDLIYDVILRLRNDMQLAKFKLLVHKYPVPLALYIKYCRENSAEALEGIFTQEDDFNAQALHLISDFCKLKPYDRELCIANALDAYKKGRNEFNASLCDEALRLVRTDQKVFEEKLKTPFTDLSISDTLRKLMVLNQPRLADKFRNDYKIPEKRYWHICIDTYGELNKFDELERLSKLKKSPIGYAPFVDVCLKHRKEGEAKKYLPRVADELKVKYYIKANLLEEAAQIAFEQRDMQNLLQIQVKCQQLSAAGSASSSSASVSAHVALNDKINSYISAIGVRK